MTTTERRTRERRLALLGLLIAALQWSCSAGTTPEPRLGAKAEIICPPQDSDDYYHPHGSVVANNLDGVDNFLRESFARYLRNADVAALWCGPIDEGYRVLWLPAYRPAAIVELTKRGNDWRLVRVDFRDPRVVAHDSSANPFLVSNRSQSIITKPEAALFLRALDKSSFWSIPGYLDSRQEDGHRWLIEGRKDGLYRVVTRHGVDDKLVQDVALELTKLTGRAITEEMLPTQR